MRRPGSERAFCREKGSGPSGGHGGRSNSQAASSPPRSIGRACNAARRIGKEKQLESSLLSVEEHIRSMAGASMREIANVYENGFRRFLRVAEAITGNLDEARDAVQDGFARAISHRRDYRGEGELEGWVWRCVVNAARSASRRRELPMHDLPEQVDNSHSDSIRPSLEGVLAELPERQRLVRFLRYYADLHYRAIADTLDIEVGTAGATLHKGHDAGRRCV